MATQQLRMQHNHNGDISLIAIEFDDVTLQVTGVYTKGGSRKTAVSIHHKTDQGKQYQAVIAAGADETKTAIAALGLTIDEVPDPLGKEGTTFFTPGNWRLVSCNYPAPAGAQVSKL